MTRKYEKPPGRLEGVVGPNACQFSTRAHEKPSMDPPKLTGRVSQGKFLESSREALGKLLRRSSLSCSSARFEGTDPHTHTMFMELNKRRPTCNLLWFPPEQSCTNTHKLPNVPGVHQHRGAPRKVRGVCSSLSLSLSLFCMP